MRKSMQRFRMRRCCSSYCPPGTNYWDPFNTRRRRRTEERNFKSNMPAKHSSISLVRWKAYWLLRWNTKIKWASRLLRWRQSSQRWLRWMIQSWGPGKVPYYSSPFQAFPVYGARTEVINTEQENEVTWNRATMTFIQERGGQEKQEKQRNME